LSSLAERAEAAGDAVEFVALERELDEVQTALEEASSAASEVRVVRSLGASGGGGRAAHAGGRAAGRPAVVAARGDA